MTEQEIFEQQELRRIDRLPEPAKTNAKKFMSFKPQSLPQNPKKNVWYYYRPEDCICSNGTPYYSSLKIGTENKLLVMFCGGGGAFNAYCAARPDTYVKEEGKETFYFPDTFVLGYFAGHSGVANKDNDKNPFKDWSVVVVSYGTGDFHCGTNDFEFNDQEIGKGVCHHRGYFNYRAMIEKMKELIPNPDRLLVTGYSAGGFGTALLTDDIMDVFSECNDVTCLPDSGVFSFDLRNTVENQWKAPKAIYSRIKTDNITLDALLDLHKKHGNRVKIAFGCSYRDALLSQCQAYADGSGMIFSKEYGDKFQEVLKNTIERLSDEIPDIAVFIFDKPNPEVSIGGLTEHCFIAADYIFDFEQDGVKVVDWIDSAVKGKPLKVGLHLLGL